MRVVLATVAALAADGLAGAGGVSPVHATTAALPPNDGRSHATALGAALAAIEGATIGWTVAENGPRSRIV